MRKTFRYLTIAVFLLAVATPESFACSSKGCVPPFGYIEQCFAQCGLPGSCTSNEEQLDYCLLTADGYGCHDGHDDPCCCTESGF